MKLHELFEAEKRSVLSLAGKQPEVFEGDFSCSFNKLTSLEGCPSVINGHFSCCHNLLTSLEGGPNIVETSFHAEHNKLTSLKGAPSKINKDFYCHSNELTSLEGAPSFIGGDFKVFRNNLTSLHNIHKHIKYIGGDFDFSENLITSNILGLLLIDGLQRVFLDNDELYLIINKHLSGDKDLFACQEDLIEAGLDDFAQL